MQVLSKELLIENLMTLALKRRTSYNNKAPFNCGYCHPDDSISADCWCLFKAIVWSHGTLKDNHTAGKYFYVDAESGLEDRVGEWIMNNCEDVSTDFSKIETGEVLLYYDKSHWGHYVGEFQDATGICNCVESTMSFDQCITTSYVDEYGRRFDHKGGTQYGSWGWHGKPTKWVSGYGEQPKPEPYVPTEETVSGMVDDICAGKYGNFPERVEKIYRHIQDEVNKAVAGGAKGKFHESYTKISEVVEAVIAGEFGNGDDRKMRLYRLFQDLVNQKLS